MPVHFSNPVPRFFSSQNTSSAPGPGPAPAQQAQSAQQTSDPAALIARIRAAERNTRHRIVPKFVYYSSRERKQAAGNAVRVPHFMERAQHLAALRTGDRQFFLAYARECADHKRAMFEIATTPAKLRNALACANILHGRPGYNDRLEAITTKFFDVIKSKFIEELGADTFATNLVAGTRARHVVNGSRLVGLCIRDESIPGTENSQTAGEALSAVSRTAAIYREYSRSNSDIQSNIGELLEGMEPPASGEARPTDSVFLALMERILHFQYHPELLQTPPDAQPELAGADSARDDSISDDRQALVSQQNPERDALVYTLQQEFSGRPDAEKNVLRYVTNAIQSGEVKLGE